MFWDSGKCFVPMSHSEFRCFLQGAATLVNKHLISTILYGTIGNSKQSNNFNKICYLIKSQPNLIPLKFISHFQTTNSYGIGSNVSGVFLLVRTKCERRGGVG